MAENVNLIGWRLEISINGVMDFNTRLGYCLGIQVFRKRQLWAANVKSHKNSNWQ